MVVKLETIHRVHNILVVHFGVGYEIAHAVNHAIASPYAIVQQLADWAWNNEFEHGLTCDNELFILTEPNGGLIQTQILTFFNPDAETQMRIHFQTPMRSIDLEWKTAKDTYILKYGKEVNRAWRTTDGQLSTAGVFKWLEFIMEKFAKA